MLEKPKILNTTPIRRRKPVIMSLSSLDASSPNIWIVPRVGRSDKSIRRKIVVLPAPDGPVRN